MTDISQLAAKGDTLDLAIAEAKGEITFTKLPRKNAPRRQVYKRAEKLN